MIVLNCKVVRRGKSYYAFEEYSPFGDDLMTVGRSRKEAIEKFNKKLNYHVYGAANHPQFLDHPRRRRSLMVVEQQLDAMHRDSQRRDNARRNCRRNTAFTFGV